VVSKDDQENEGYMIAVVCAEVCAVIEDEEENKIPIGRKYKILYGGPEKRNFRYPASAV